MRFRHAISMIAMLSMLMPPGICICDAACSTPTPALEKQSTRPTGCCHCKSHRAKDAADRQTRSTPAPKEHRQDCPAAVAPELDRAAVIATPLIATVELAIHSWLIITADGNVKPIDIESVRHVHDPPIYLSQCSFLI